MVRERGLLDRAPAWLGAAGALGGLLAWALSFEPRRVAMRPETLRLPGWPHALEGTRVAVIADFHTGSGHVDERRVARVVARVNREGPELVALLGDYVTPEAPEQRPERVAALLGELRAPLGVFAVLGNHDWARDGA